MPIRDLDPDNDYAYDATNQSVNDGPRWSIQRDNGMYPLTQWAVWFNHKKIETGFATRQAAEAALVQLKRATK